MLHKKRPSVETTYTRRTADRFLLIYFGFIFAVIFVVYRWAAKVISLKKENNALSKEIIKRMDSHQTIDNSAQAEVFVVL
jgi:hypothetical protein